MYINIHRFQFKKKHWRTVARLIQKYIRKIENKNYRVKDRIELKIE